MRFITLTKTGGAPILINPMMITLMDILAAPNKYEPKTSVYIMGGGLCHVIETAEEIQKLIKESERITTTTWETGPK
jgi:uncharacterized protein YlzI (FlbEa/FlbD family)